MKLQTNQTDIQVNEMKDGEIAIITKWERNSDSIGLIVQRHNETIICLQEATDARWLKIPTEENCRVRILQKGEVLIIE